MDKSAPTSPLEDRVAALHAQPRLRVWSLVVTLLGMYLGAVFGPPPPDARALVIFAFGAWILLAWGWWVSRHREHG